MMTMNFPYRYSATIAWCDTIFVFSQLWHGLIGVVVRAFFV